MGLRDLYRKGKGFPFVTCFLAFMCLLVSVPTYFKPDLYNVLALWMPPTHIWQYITGIFEHGIEPQWFLWVHLIMNLMGLLPFGVLVERMLGSKKTLMIFITEWLVTIALFQLLRHGQQTSMAGISSIVYAYATIAFVCFVKLIKHEGKRVWKQGLTYYFAFEFLGLITMLNPITTGWVSLWLHLSGIGVGALFYFRNKKLIANFCVAFRPPRLKPDSGR